LEPRVDIHIRKGQNRSQSQGQKKKQSAEERVGVHKAEKRKRAVKETDIPENKSRTTSQYGGNRTYYWGNKGGKLMFNPLLEVLERIRVHLGQGGGDRREQGRGGIKLTGGNPL